MPFIDAACFISAFQGIYYTQFSRNDMGNRESPFPPPYDQIKIGKFSNLEMSGGVLQ